MGKHSVAYLRGYRVGLTGLERLDDGGQPCGQSYIAPGLECHAGQGQKSQQRAGQGKAAIASKAKSMARNIAGAARGMEPAVTRTLSSVAESAGGQMVGLRNKLKTEESLSRKIATKAELANIPPEQVRITDALRYTMQLGEDVYTDSIRKTVQELEAKGVKMVELENNWDKGDAYNGVNALFEQNGTIFELQFHTPASIEAKAKIHPYYEEFRQLDTSPQRKKELFDQMVDVSDSAPQPTGILDLELGVKRFRPFEG